MDDASRLKVGIFFNARRSQGGLYQYALTLVDCLYRFVPEFDYSLYLATLDDFPLVSEKENWQVHRLPKLSIQIRMSIEYFLSLTTRTGITPLVRSIPEYQQVLKDQPDIMLYVKPTLHASQWNYPAIFPIHDLQHQLQPEFKEVSEKGEFKRREHLYKGSFLHAQAILTDSIIGKEDVQHFYKVDPKIVFPLPYIAPTFRDNFREKKSFREIRKEYAIPEQYFFYPAAFWPHKNHARLIEAINKVQEEHGEILHVVFSGSKNREYASLVALVKKLGLEDAVHFIGYVSESELRELYEHSLALVMPTFFGPTNIPILEAWSAKCPVITSDIRGIREQVGEAGLLVNPLDQSAIANALWRIYKRPELRKELIESGNSRVKLWTPRMFARKLADIILLSYQNERRKRTKIK
jgi:glycosyltransferase involved in cell wall biosynthesis